jgi:hypothetical protein
MDSDRELLLGAGSGHILEIYLSTMRTQIRKKLVIKLKPVTKLLAKTISSDSPENMF